MSNVTIEPILDDNGYVCGYDFTDVVLSGVEAEVQGSDLFTPGSKWKDKDCLHNSVKLHLSKTGRMISTNRQTFSVIVMAHQGLELKMVNPFTRKET